MLMRKKKKIRKGSKKSDIILIHISDLHIGQNAATTKGASHLLQSIIKKYRKLSSKVYIVITGDIWNAFGERDKSKAKEVFEKSSIFEIFQRDHVLICPGNHDALKRPTRRGEYYDSLKNDPFFFPEAFPVHKIVRKGSKSYHFIGLDSSKKKTNNGNIGRSQLDFLENELQRIHHEERSTITTRAEKTVEVEEVEEETTEEKENQKLDHSIPVLLPGSKKVVVYLHHNPFITYQKKILFDRKEFIDVVHGKCDVLLFGHFHRHRRLDEEEAKQKIKVILASGKSSSVKAYREIRFYQNGEIGVKDIKLTLN